MLLILIPLIVFITSLVVSKVYKNEFDGQKKKIWKVIMIVSAIILVICLVIVLIKCCILLYAAFAINGAI